MKFCSDCGAPVGRRVPPGDHLPRYVCDACGSIHYQNPKMVVGSIPQWEDRILLCRRAIEPRYGLWTLPAGFMENHETAAEAAAREAHEEAAARVEIGALFGLYNLPQVSQVYLIFRGRLLDPGCAPGAESLEVALLREAEVPWDRLAFRVIEQALRQFFHDRRLGRHELHVADIAARWDQQPAASPGHGAPP
jgi:ADP-ribose pyrophosphatase YjhB (NUDIX family)